MKLTHLYATELAGLVTPVAPQLPQGLTLQMVNRDLANDLSLPQNWWQDNYLGKQLSEPEFALSRRSVAQKYGGHQFGQWNPMLGDGRGLLLGEVEDRRGQRLDLHLKGAGQTPYSRQGDGRAVLRSTLREYIGSEALHHLGIPTSRSLCLFDSPEPVARETFEPAAAMIRTAPSHIRFGHFEYYYYQGDEAALKQLFEHVFIHHFPACLEQRNPHLALLETIVLRTARLVALWQAYGFVHGVMNTDNMSIHGITFDYGPYAFMDNFVSNAVFNHTDHQGRYAFDQQPGIALWNLNALAQAFSGHCSIEQIKQALMRYEPTFMQHYQQRMMHRLGFAQVDEAGIDLLHRWLTLLANEQRDAHLLFRQLGDMDVQQATVPLRDSFIDRGQFDSWWQAYRQARQANGDTAAQQALMHSVNPAVVARTHHLQAAIDDAEHGDYRTAQDLLQALQRPFEEAGQTSRWACPPVDASPVSLSCSS